MRMDSAGRLATRHPSWVVAAWFALAAIVLATAPDLTRLAAEGQAKLLPRDSESVRAAEVIRQTWPDQSYESLAVVALFRKSGLISADHQFARKLATGFDEKAGRSPDVLRVLGPNSPPEIAERLISKDRTYELVAVPLNGSFVSPNTKTIVAWMEAKAAAIGPPPAGLEVLWTGDAVIGRDYMHLVQQSLDRAALATVFLLLAVLLAVYRSLLLAVIPLVTIGVALAISRGVLGWMASLGWEISPLVELFLIVLLFGCGTDFCLFLSWRFGEYFDASNPANSMREALKRSWEPIVTSAGTVIVGLSLMGTTRFKLFSSTGPSVAIGLAITVVICLTLTPALLVLLATFRPGSFAGLTKPSSGFWDNIGHRVLARPVRTWLATVLVLGPIGAIGLTTTFVQDTLTEMPQTTASVQYLYRITKAFGPGRVAPLYVVIRGIEDFRNSTGLALIDDVSRFLTQKRIVEVRSATQPLGSRAPLARARLESRLEEVDEGFHKLSEGAAKLRDGLALGASRLQAALRLEKITGIPFTGAPPPEAKAREEVGSGLRQAAAALFGVKKPDPSPRPNSPPPPKAEDPRQEMVKQLFSAVQGAAQIAEGSSRAHQEIAKILADPVGQRALNRLLITPGDLKDHPELLRSFAAYISPDGKLARFDVEQAERMFSAEAMQQTLDLRRRLREYLAEHEGVEDASLGVAGPNAESADIWALTREDQIKTWIIVPLGVFLVLMFTLRDFWACVNLVLTMLMTYAFALGATHLVFVTILGADGLDWKVPYFLFVLLVAVGVDYNIFLMTRLREETHTLGLKAGINRAIAQTGGLISSAAAITAASFASFLTSPLGSLRQLGFALVIGIFVDAVVVRPVLVPIGHWLIHRRAEKKRDLLTPGSSLGKLEAVTD